MQNYDLNYICMTIGNLSGIPIRLYKNGQQVLFYSMVSLIKDPILPYEKEILMIEDKVGYYTTNNLNYYGILNIENHKIILGPTRFVPNTEQDLHEIALSLDIPAEHIDEFLSSMKSIVGLPLEFLIRMLCLLSYLYCGEATDLNELMIYESNQHSYEKELIEQQVNFLSEEQVDVFHQSIDNTYLTECTMTDIISRGDIAALEQWLHLPHITQRTPLAVDLLRHKKNTFITTATLASRAAIHGGMHSTDAISIANEYIKKCELQNSLESISNLQYHMIKTFTYKVHQLNLGKHPSKLVLDVVNYIHHHLSTHITTQDIADALYMSRPHLSKKFKAETGQNLNEFILTQKINEAKRLLKYTDKSLLAIAVYLGFSTQSHFTHVFKKITGKTPSEYR